MTTDTAQSRNRKEATIPVVVCPVCFVSVPEDSAEAHVEWHIGRATE